MNAITGIGIICSIGTDAPSVLRFLREGRSGVSRMRYLHSAHTELPVGEVPLSDDEMKRMLSIDTSEIVSRTTLLGAIAVRQALAQAGITSYQDKRVVIINGTTVGGMDITEHYFKQIQTDDSYLKLLDKHDAGSCTRDIADMAGLLDAEVCTISTACSSSINSIILGSEMLKTDEADIVIAGGSEALSRFHLNGFNTLMILDHEQCRPFDAERKGLNLGEGAAFVVLQKDAPHPLAYVTGYANRCDAFHQTASSENGEGAYLAMRDALKMASLTPEDINYINAHGTGTPNNDSSESAAIRRVFGDIVPPVSSTKSYTGHTTSASGAIETVISILSLLNDFIPANIGFKNPDPSCIIPSLGQDDVTLNNILCNSFGFGGNDSSLIISRTPHVSSPEVPYGDLDLKILSESTLTSEEELKDVRAFLSPMEARRMGKLMKAATITSLSALQAANIDSPDAIITATAYGMLQNSERFLIDMSENGEQSLSPTLFMQSTHNTLSSAIAIRTHCHGYNTTYTQGEDSLRWALRDASRLLHTGQAKTVLVGYHDEATPLFQSFFTRQGKTPPPALYSHSLLLSLNS